MAAESDAPSGVHLYLVLVKAFRAVSARARESIDAMELGFTDFVAMEMLLHKGPQRVNDFGQRLDLTSGSITALVDRLEARGLVRREASPDDGRARVVSLTAAGRTLITRAFAAHRARLDATMSVLSPREAAKLEKLLKKLGRAAEAARSGTGRS